MFISDRDLVVYEPNLFRDAGWLGQKLGEDVVGISGTTMTALTMNFVSAGIEAGHVVTLEQASYEVVQRLSATTLQVSRIRAKRDGVAIAPPAIAAGNARFWTLSPQIGLAHAQVLRMIGLDSASAGALGTGAAGVLDESRVTNPGDLERLEALLTLHTVYSALAALRSADDPFSLRAEMYRQRAREERQRAVAYIDTDFDGKADVCRRLNAVVLSR